MKQNVGQLLTVQWSSPKRNSKKTGFTQYGHQNPEKRQVWKIFKIPGNSRRVNGNSRWPWPHSKIQMSLFTSKAGTVPDFQMSGPLFIQHGGRGPGPYFLSLSAVQYRCPSAGV